jgi:predicted GNAT family N-acyltransferase
VAYGRRPRPAPATARPAPATARPAPATAHLSLCHPFAVTATVDYEVRRAQGEHELRDALALRHDVFCVEQGVPQREEVDGRDPEGIHLVAVADGRLLATCRLLIVGRTAQFSRLAVLASARRRGIATALLEAAEAESRAAGAARIVLHAQTYARSLYDRVGYRPRGAVFWEAGIEHVAMEKELD